MDISRFFIDRPRFAGVISIFIFLVGVLAIFRLPISEYPEVAPPQIVVRAQFPGANPRVISETVATPLEEQINGVENLLYFDSQASADGSLTLTVTFKIGTNPEVAETAVQNRINRALPRVPDIVRQIGVTTEKSSPNLTMVVHLVSPDNSHDALYLRNYGQLNVRDELLRIPGMGSVIMFGAGDYAMRIWLDPAKLAARSLTTGEVIAAIREQNAQVAAGTVGASPAPAGTEFQLAVNTQGRLANEEEFADIIVRTDPSTGGLIRIRDLGRVELSSGTYSLRSLLNNKEAAAIAIFQAPGSNALALSNAVRAKMEQLKPDFPQGMGYSIVYDPTRFVQTSILKVIETLFIAVAAGRARRHHLPADLARLDHPAPRRAGVDRRHVRVPAPARLLDQHADAVRPGARDRHRRRRRDRRGRERRAPHRRGHERARRDGQGDAGGLGADRRDRARPLRGVHSARLRPRPDRACSTSSSR
jgi:multidrug efflux pump